MIYFNINPKTISLRTLSDLEFSIVQLEDNLGLTVFQTLFPTYEHLFIRMT